MYRGECIGGPLDGERVSSGNDRYLVPLPSPVVPVHEVGHALPTDTHSLRAGIYLWDGRDFVWQGEA